MSPKQMQKLDLLPSNALPAERALSFAAQFGDDILPEDIKKLWRPQEAPAAFLPFLAWGLHVDFWREGLPDQAKRNLIAGSFEWHRLEGTFGAIRRICNAVFGETRIQAWHEYGGEPYSFRISTEGFFRTQEEWDTLREAIAFAQALRDRLERIEIRRSESSRVWHGIASIKGGLHRLGITVPPASDTSSIYTGIVTLHGGCREHRLAPTPPVAEPVAHRTGVTSFRGGRRWMGLPIPSGALEVGCAAGVGLLQIKVVKVKSIREVY